MFLLYKNIPVYRPVESYDCDSLPGELVIAELEQKGHAAFEEQTLVEQRESGENTSGKIPTKTLRGIDASSRAPCALRHSLTGETLRATLFPHTISPIRTMLPVAGILRSQRQSGCVRSAAAGRGMLATTFTSTSGIATASPAINMLLSTVFLEKINRGLMR